MARDRRSKQRVEPADSVLWWNETPFKVLEATATPSAVPVMVNVNREQPFHTEIKLWILSRMCPQCAKKFLALHVHPELPGLCTSWQSHTQMVAEQVQFLSLYSGSANACTLEGLAVLNKMWDYFYCSWSKLVHWIWQLCRVQRMADLSSN